MALRNQQTLLFSIFFLFFIQLFGLWVESIYRISLGSKSAGVEVFGVLLVLCPLFVCLVRESKQKAFFNLAFVLVLITRFSSGFFGVTGLATIAGIGVGASLIVLSYLLSGRFRLQGSQVATAVAYALLCSIALRAWGSSVDISTQGDGEIIGWFLVATALFLFVKTGWPEREPIGGDGTGKLGSFIAIIGLFGNFVLCYLILFNPNVISAWSGGSYLAFVAITLLAFTVVLIFESSIVRYLGDYGLAFWNVVFVTCLVVGILIHTPDFPATGGTPAILVGESTLTSLIPFYLMCLLSPVVLFNIRYLLQRSLVNDPRTMALAVLLGATFMMVVTISLILTNTWGYEKPFSLPFRGMFYLPYLLTGGVILVSIVVIARRDTVQYESALFFRGGALVISILAILGVFVRGSGAEDGLFDQKQLSVLTYNIQVGSQKNGDRSYEEQLAVIERISPDLIGLQESDSVRSAGWNTNVARYFADELGYHLYNGPSTVAGTFGTAILSKFPIENAQTLYSFSTKDEIGTALIEVEVAGRRIAFFNSHPAGQSSANGDPRQAHLDALIDAAKDYDHVIAVGDYNMRQGSPGYAALSKVLLNSWEVKNTRGSAEQALAKEEEQDSSAKPKKKKRLIDHIFVSESFHVEDSFYIPTSESMSDHPAHWSVLSWN